MRKSIFTLFALLLPFVVQGQVKIGYFSYEKALSSMAEYQSVQSSLDNLKSQYAAETQRVEDEFNKKYEEFLDGQSDFAPTILQKRQSELQELMVKNISFKREAERLLRQAEQEAMAPLREKLSAAVRAVGEAYGFTLILNTDGDHVQYVDAALGEDVTTLILSRLK